MACCRASTWADVGPSAHTFFAHGALSFLSYSTIYIFIKTIPMPYTYPIHPLLNGSSMSYFMTTW